MVAEVFCEGLDHPEGVAVHPHDGSVWCGGEAGQVYRVAPDGRAVTEVAVTGGSCLGLAFGHAGELYVCDCERAAVMRVDGGRVERFATGPRTPNACAVDADGRLYVTDSRDRDDPGPGIFRFDPDGNGGEWCSEPMHFANGIALAADGSGLYVAETWARRVLRVEIAADGRPGAVSVVADLPGTLPDGVAVADDGSVFVACYEPSQILRIAPGGAVATVLADPDAHLLCHPTNVAFRGRELFAANLGRRHLTRIDPAAAGVPLPLEACR
jgi:sugar lactone lactonase YvrE